MGILENLGLSGLSNTLSGLGNTISNFGDNIDNRTGGLLTRLGQPDNQANLITAASLLSGEGIPASFALRNQVRSNLLANQQFKRQREFIKKQFPNDRLAQAFPQLYAKQFLEKKFSTTAPKVDALGLGNTQSERSMGNLITLGKKIQDGTASESQKILYGMLYEKAKKGQTYSQTDPTTGVTTTFQSGKMNLTGLPVPTGYEDKTTLGTSANYSDAQTLSSGFANMMIKSEEKLNELAGTDYLPQEDLVGAYLGGGKFSQRALSSEAQQFQLSALNFVQAVLRKESGAAISQEEFADAYRRYFPQYGDATGTIDFKRELRKEAIKGMINTSGGHFGSLESRKDFDIETLYKQPSPSNNNASLTQGTIDFGNLSGLSTTDFLAIYKEAKNEINKPPSQRKYTQKEYEKLKQELMKRTNK